MSESGTSINGALCKTLKLENGYDSHGLTKEAVVVLTRLPECKVRGLQPVTPQPFYSEDESPSSSDSDMQWEPEGDSGDSDFSYSRNKVKAVKPAKSDAAKPLAPPTSTNKTPNNGHSSDSDVLLSNNKPKVANPTKSDAAKPLAPPAGTNRAPNNASGQCSNETRNVRPDLPEEEVKVNMTVLARKRHMCWQRGKIMEIITKDGRLKYKVSFEEKGKSLVSGHHIAFDHTARLEQLYVGARVAIQSKDNKSEFCPGILSELPSRNNRLRFLIFMDDHTPVYVGLPMLHLVCRPLDDVLEDLPDGRHLIFMKQYLKDWPYPHLTQYRVGQTFIAELHGVEQRCEVQVVDCSLMQVVFQKTNDKEWIHRGSIRLQHMARFFEIEGENKDSD